MEIRFKQKSKIIDISIVLFAGIASVSMMIYAVFHFGLKNSWNELVLNMFYIACLTMTAMYFFKVGITTHQLLLRDILFPPPLINYPLHLACMTLSVMLVLMLIFFYSRKDWITYSKRNLWMICIVDMVLATLYNIDILLEPTDEYTAFMLTEIWIRPTITYGLVACFIDEKEGTTESVR